MGVVHLELFENDFQDGLFSKVHVITSVFLRYPPIETINDDGSDSVPRLPINAEVSAQTCLIISVDLEDAGIFGISLYGPSRSEGRLGRFAILNQA